MSQLKQNLTDNIMASMKARKLERVKVLRNVQAVIKQIEIDRRIELDDADVLEVLQKQLKQRQESLTIFTENSRDDLAAKSSLRLILSMSLCPSKWMMLSFRHWLMLRLQNKGQPQCVIWVVSWAC